MSEPEKKTPWWAALFAPTRGNKPLTYRQLADRVDELEQQLARSGREVAKFRHRSMTRARDAEDALEKYRLALEWYADLASYRPYGLAKLVRVLEDKGHRARKALGRV